MLITLKEWQKKVCEKPKVLIEKDPWNGKGDQLIPCGKCQTCKKNILLLKGKTTWDTQS